MTTLAGCSAATGASGSGGDKTLTLYNGQHPQTTQVLVSAFEKKTGIHVNIRSGEGSELVNQVITEGSASPADVLYTEDSPDMSVVQGKNLFAKVDASTLKQVPSTDSSTTGRWVGVTARAAVLVYSPSLVPKAKLPHSILDLAKPQWKGKVGIEPSSGSLQAMVTAVRLLKGTAATKQWLAGLKANAKLYNSHNAILKAVDANQIATGILNNYYWFRLRASSGSASVSSRLLYFGHQDPGSLVDVSGAGVLRSAPHPKAAQAFLAYIVSPAGQRVIAHSDSYEYPLNPKVSPNPALPPFTTLDPPKVSLAQLGRGQTKSLSMLRQAGFSL